MLKLHNFLALLIAFFAGLAAFLGIYSHGGSGQYTHTSIRGKEIMIYGTGIYKDMSTEVAIQGIAQDYVTLYLAVPLLLISLYFALRGSRKWKYVLTSVVGYLLITYLLYLNMAMYNALFLVYTILLGGSFFLLLSLLIQDHGKALNFSSKHTPLFMRAGIFLMINATLIALLWLSVVIPPLLDETIVPLSAEHYTTLTVQGIDLALLLPMSFIAGYLCIKKHATGPYFTLIYTMTLTVLMMALCSKIVFMANTGVNVVPAVFIIPTITLLAAYNSLKMMGSIKE